MLHNASRAVFWLAVITILTTTGPARVLGAPPAHRNARHKHAIHKANRNGRAAIVHRAVAHASRGRVPADTHLFGNSVASLSREIQRETREAKEQGGEESEGPDFLQSYLFYIRQRAFPKDSVDWNAWARAADHRDQMLPAVTPAWGDKITGKWRFFGPNSLPVPYQQYFGKSPLSGRVNGVAYDPTHAGTYYICAAGGGVWKTTNSGNTWSCLSNGAVWKFQQAGSIALDPNQSGTLYVAANDPFFFAGGGRYLYSSILHSKNAGANWDALDTSSFGTATINKIIVDPDTPGLIMAVTGTLDGTVPGNIWRSTNSGKTWSAASNVAAFWTDIVYGTVPSGGTRNYYACGFSSAAGSKVYVSKNHGASWTSHTVNVQKGIDVAASATSANTVYLLAGADRKIYKSTNAGGAWSNITGNFPNGNSSVGAAYNWSQNSYDYFIGCSANNQTDVIYVGLIDVAQSTNGGTSWKSIGGPSYATGSLIHNDQHAWAVNPSNPNDMLVGNDGGVFHLVYTPSTGASAFTSLNAKLGITQFYHMDVDQAIDGVLLGGTQDNATPALAGSVSKWINVGGGDGSWAAVSPANPSIQYSTTESDFTTGRINIFRTTNAWANGSVKDIGFVPTSGVVQFFTPILVTASDSNSLYIATNLLWHYDTINKWTGPLGNQTLSGSNAYVLTMAAGCAGNTLYTGSLDGLVYRTPDAGTTWSEIHGSLPTRSITSVSVDPGDANSILVGLGGTGADHLWQCLDTSVASPQWIDVTGAGATGLPDVQLNAVARDPNDPQNTWYVGTDVGVFQTSDAGTTWKNATLPLGLPNVEVTDLKSAPGTGYLYASTFGRGVWKINLSGKGAYNVVDLDVAGDHSSQALAVNSSMQIAGSLLTTSAALFGNVWTTPTTPVRWGLLSGGSQSAATAINSAGSVVGYADDSNGTDHAVIWFLGNQTLHNLETQNQGIISQAYGINDAGQVVGQRGNHAFFWQSDVQGFIDLGTLGGASSEAAAINNAPNPQIVGWAAVAAGSQHAFRHVGTGALTANDDLGTLGGASSQATAINDLGEVVGYATTASGATHAFKTSVNKAINLHTDDLGTLGGTISKAYAITDTGLVVGESYDANGNLHAFIWDSVNGMQDLNNLIPANSGWVLESAQGICDCGCIVGYGFVNGHTHAFLLML